MPQRPRELTPEAGPRHFVGAELRARREARNMSLSDLSREIHIDKSHLSRFERAERPIPAEVLARCDDALKADGALARLGALLAAEDRGHVANSAADVARPTDALDHVHVHEAPLVAGDGDAVTIPVRAADGRIMYVSISRREFFGVGAAATALSAAASPSAAAAELPPVEHFRQLRKTLADSDNLFGPQRVMAAVREQIDLLQSLRQGQRGADYRALAGVQTEFADLLSWLHQDSGEHDAAAFWLDRALEWSHLTGDINNTAFILTRKSHLASDIGNGAEAAEVAEASVSLAPANSRMAAIASAQATRGYALLGDQTGTERAHDRTLSLLGTADDDELPWGQFFGPAYVTAHYAESQRLLGNHWAAAGQYRLAIDQMPVGFRRDQGVYLAREALAFVGAGDAEQAAQTGLRALSIGNETGSTRILTDLHKVQSLLQASQAEPARQFATELQASPVVVRRG